jgi:hypothetical protein
MNLILDMDGTLVGCNANFRLDMDGKPTEVTCYPRPWLKEFLSFCFRNFASVSIWTAATRTWFEIVDARIFQPIIRDINSEDPLGKYYQWKLAITQEHCLFHSTENEILTYKPLFRLWYSTEGAIPGFTSTNTLAIDDSPCTFTYNPHNGLVISRFHGPDDGDTALLTMINTLHYFIDMYKKIGDVQCIMAELIEGQKDA